jgi:hypothetical protein
VSGPLFGRTLASLRTRWLLVGVALFGWGMLIPVIYVAFSDAIRDLANSGAIPEQLLNFGSGSLFSLPGAVTLGTQHPIAIALLSVFAVGASSVAVAGERQRGRSSSRVRSRGAVCTPRSPSPSSSSWPSRSSRCSPDSRRAPPSRG